MVASVQRKFVLLLCLFIFHSIPVAVASVKAAAPSPSKSSVVQPLKSYINSTEEQIDTDQYSDLDFTTVSPLVKKFDYHVYYNSSFNIEVEKWKEYWINFEYFKETVTVLDFLSTSYRKSTMVTLSFDFPFYGHKIRNLRITTEGFIFTGEYVHGWLAATQYIAPLMANFDPSLHNDTMVKYLDNGTAFTVQWENVHLQDKIEAGKFTFQVTLLNNGDIIFVYKAVPIMITTISDEIHSVKVGISDAYIIEKPVFFLKKKSIYEYHRINLASRQIGSTTSIYFTALPTCIGLSNCSTCRSAKIGFDCVWCGGRCSDGMDRQRQNWIQDGCEQVKVTHCPGDKATDGNTGETDAVTHFVVEHALLSTAGIVGVLFVVAMTVGFIASLACA